jgi:hypothetical protein
VIPNNLLPDYGDEIIYPNEEEVLDVFEMRPLQGPTGTTPIELYIFESQKRHLLERVYNNQTLAEGNNALTAFKTLALDSDEQQEIEIADQRELVVRLSEEEQSARLALESQAVVVNQSIDTLLQELEAFIEADNVFGFTKQEELNSKFAQINQLDKDFLPIKTTINNRVTQRLSDFIQRLESTSPAGKPLENWITLLKIESERYLEQAVGSVYQAVDTDIILEIAKQCPWTGGDAVYLARVIVNSWDDDAEYLFPANCESTERSFLTSPLEGYDVFPNPGTGIVTLTSPDEIVRYVVANGMEEEIMKFNVNGQSKSLDLTAQADGIYFIKCLNHSGRIVNTLKYVKISK